MESFQLFMIIRKKCILSKGFTLASRSQRPGLEHKDLTASMSESWGRVRPRPQTDEWKFSRSQRCAQTAAVLTTGVRCQWPDLSWLTSLHQNMCLHRYGGADGRMCFSAVHLKNNWRVGTGRCADGCLICVQTGLPAALDSVWICKVTGIWACIWLRSALTSRKWCCLDYVWLEAEETCRRARLCGTHLFHI